MTYLQEIIANYDTDGLVDAVATAIAQLCGADYDDYEGSLACALYWYGVEWHAGMYDWRYSLQCEVSGIFSPSPGHGDSHDAFLDDDMADDIYQEIIRALEGAVSLENYLLDREELDEDEDEE